MQFFKNKLRNFGIKRPTRFKGQRFNGYAAPLWFNPFPRLFIALAVVTFIIILVILLQYVFDVVGQPDCDSNVRVFLILFMIVLLLETISNFVFYSTEIGSDIEWSRRLTFLGVACGLIAILGAVCLVVRLAKAGTVTDCKEWTVGLIYSIILIAYSVIKGLVIIYCVLKFYRSHSLLARKEPKEIDVV